MYSVTTDCVSLAFHSFIKIGKYLWIFFNIHYFVSLKKKKKKKKKKRKEILLLLQLK